MYSELKNKLSEEFEKNEFLLNGPPDSIMNRRRKEAFKNFSGIDFPNRKHEEWKYDDLKFLENDFHICMKKQETEISKEIFGQFLFNGLRDNMLVFVNGFLSSELSSVVSEDIVISSLSDAKEEYPELVNKHFGAYTKDNTEPFTALNTALAPDGAFIYIPGGKNLFEKIQLIFITDARERNVLVQPRNLIIAGDNSEARIVQACYTIGPNIGFTNLVTEIVIGQNALLGFYKIHNCRGNSYYIGTSEASQGKNSTYNNASISLKGKFQRNNIHTTLDGERSEANFYGFYLTDDEDFVDHHTLIDHAVPNCRSNENYKGIIDKKGKAVFNGKVMVRKNAQKTEAYQSNKNILLSDEAVIYTKPQLEIYADDVKCSHGATSGNIDKEAMFYLRARGIEEDKARALLLNAFASDIIQNVNVHALRDFMKRQIAERLTRGDIYFCEVLQSN